MNKPLKIILISFLFVICFVLSILFVLWSKMPALQNYIPPRKMTSANLKNQVLFGFKSNGKYGCIDKQGRIIIEPKFDDIHCSEDDLIPAEINRKFGFINQTGEIVLEPQFILPRAGGYSKYFSEGLAVACINQKCGFIDSSGNFVIEPKFDHAENFSEGFALAQIGNFDFLGFNIRKPKTVLINKNGEIMFDKENQVIESGFSEGLAKVSVEGKTGFIDKTGSFIIPPQELTISDFSEGLAVCSTKSYKLGYVDKTGKVVIPQQFKQAGEFSEGLANVMFENGKYGYIDRTGKTIIEPQFDYADSFYEDRAVVMIDSRKGYIDKIGKIVIPVQFGWAERFVNGLARVGLDDENPPYENKKYGYIDKEGKFVFNPTN